MSAKGYKLLGYVVWHGGKWYLRRRGPSARTIVISGVAAGAGLVAVVAVAKRVAG